MKSSKGLYIIASFFLVIIFICPFAYLSKYSTFVSDDLCRSVLSFSDYFLNVKDWYLNHNGRYVNAFISLIPVYDIYIYRIIITSQFLIFGLVLYRFLRELLEVLEFRIETYKVLFLSILTYIVILSKLPSIFEFYYWYAAVTVYLISWIFLLFFLEFAIKYYFGKPWHFLIATPLIILINGNNELLLGFSNFILFVLLIHNLIKTYKLNIYILSLNIISWISTLILVISPGTVSRQDKFYYGGNLIGSFKVAIIYGGKFLVKNLFELPYLLFFIFIFIFVYQRSITKNIIHPLFLFLISYISISSLFFIIFYATGLFEVNTGRIGSFISSTLIILIVINLINLAAYCRNKKTYSFLMNKVAPFILIVLLLFNFVLANENYTKIRKDLLSENLEEYEKEILNRSVSIMENKGDTLILKRLKGTLLLKSGDNLLIQEEWLKHCYIESINKKYDKNIRYLIIED